MHNVDHRTLETIKVKLFKCTHCAYESNRNSNLKKHVQTQHSSKQLSKLPCNKCSKSFTNKGNLNRHMRLHHNLVAGELRGPKRKSGGKLRSKQDTRPSKPKDTSRSESLESGTARIEANEKPATVKHPKLQRTQSAPAVDTSINHKSSNVEHSNQSMPRVSTRSGGDETHADLVETNLRVTAESATAAQSLPLDDNATNDVISTALEHLQLNMDDQLDSSLSPLIDEGSLSLVDFDIMSLPPNACDEEGISDILNQPGMDVPSDLLGDETSLLDSHEQMEIGPIAAGLASFPPLDLSDDLNFDLDFSSLPVGL